MVFSSATFLFIFLPAVLAAYFILPKKCNNFVLLVFSLAFYAYGEPKGIFIMLISILGNYIFALFLRNRYKKLALVLSVVFNLGILCYYKYSGFLLSNLGITDFREVIMPIGISFFTFQGMSYVFDVYKGDTEPERNPLNVATYISLFPQLVAGPIVRYTTIEQELVTREITAEKTARGISRFIIGLSKKMLLANTLGGVAAQIFEVEPSTLSAPMAWLGAVCYAFQIFYDFSGYSDMAIGMGLMFGFHFLENFNYPYIARSITEFWQSWHMSLSTWFRDYVYIPLGGNRKGVKRQILNILIVWMLTGLWHGAAWVFVFWGLYYAVLLILEKFVWGRLLARAPRVLAHVYTLALVLFGWVIFNGSNVGHILGYVGAMFGLGDATYAGALGLAGDYKVELLAAALFSTPGVKMLGKRFKDRRGAMVLARVGLIMMFIVCIMMVVNTSFNPFIYFRF